MKRMARSGNRRVANDSAMLFVSYSSASRLNRISIRPRLFGAAAFALSAMALATAQQAAARQAPAAGGNITADPPSVTLTVDVSSQRKPISPFIYGLNFAKSAFAGA